MLSPLQLLHDLHTNGVYDIPVRVIHVYIQLFFVFALLKWRGTWPSATLGNALQLSGIAMTAHCHSRPPTHNICGATIVLKGLLVV